MQGLTNESPLPDRSVPQTLWYVPDSRIRTKRAAADAIAIAEWISGSRQQGNEPDEHALFVALHTCAYRASRRSRRKPVPPGERIEWVGRWQRIREYIVEKNLGLAYSMLRRFGSSELDQDDLLSTAMLGLARAGDRFNPWKGFRFSTYACNVMARALMRRGKRERNYRRLFPTQFDVGFERQEHPPSPQADLYVERLTRALDGNLAGLTELESSIVAQRFPDQGKGRQTFQEIGKAIGLSKERVRQIQNIALRKLRDVLDADSVLE